MTHEHNILDDDKRFVIEPKARAIIPPADIPKLMRGDHNSQRFTFELPCLIEGHDMLSCDRVEVHYTNTSFNNVEKSEDVYFVSDLKKDEEKGVAVFSWLISGNATKYAGTLSFRISFLCFDGEVVEYAWHTDECTTDVKKGANNSKTVYNAISDVLADLKATLTDNVTQDVLEAARSIFGDKVKEFAEVDETIKADILKLTEEYEAKVKELEEADSSDADALETLKTEYEAKVKELEEADAENKRILQELQIIYQTISTTATNAHIVANAAQTTASNAVTTANAAQTAASNAQSTANNAVDSANNAQDTANNAVEVANEASAKALNNQKDIENLEANKLDVTHTIWDYVVVDSDSLHFVLPSLSGNVLVKGGSWNGSASAINIGENIKHLHFNGTKFNQKGAVFFAGHCEKISGIETNSTVSFDNIADEVENCKIGGGGFANQKVSDIYISGASQTLFDSCDYVNNIKSAEGANIGFMSCKHVNPFTCPMGRTGVPKINADGTITWLDL